MKTQSPNQFYAIAGLSFGLSATLFGMHMSSAVELTPALMGIVSSVWISVSASIIGGQLKKYAK